MAILTAGGENPAPGFVDRSAYEAARKQAGRDAQAHVRLALWCEARGMTAERMKHLAAAVLNDPSDALARGLMGLVAYHGKWERPDDVSREAKDDLGREALMQEYLERRARTADKADAQWKLALWCDQGGLKDQAVAHFHAVLRLDPRREAAWRHLGYKKLGGRWVKPEWQDAAKREADEQGRANKHWKPLLEGWRSGLASRDRRRRADAEAGLFRLTDPRSVPMIWVVFASRGAEGQNVAVRLLGQVDAPGSSRALAMLALSGKSAEVRRQAIQILRQRDPRDFAPLLASLLRETIKYEVRPVNGPGSPGEILVKNKDANVRRMYSPPPMPGVPVLPNDYVGPDASGLPVIYRYAGPYNSGEMVVPGNSVAAAEAMFGLNGGNAAAQVIGHLGLPPATAGKLEATLGQAARVPIANLGGPANFPLRARGVGVESMTIPVGQMMLEYQMAARAAQEQLASDVQSIDSYNGAVRESNQRVRQILADATGTDLGDDCTAWGKWLADLFGYAYAAPSGSSYEPPTVVQQVPLAYQPQPVPVTFNVQMPGVVLQRTHACFAAGTPVRTLEGLRPIEALREGDLVLTQAPRSGELKYQVLVTVYHNPPNATYRITLETDESIVATGIHRLWKAGKGWTMVRELKLGDVLRTLGGVAAVKSVEADRTQPVYNLQVADGESYFVGTSGVLAHDNSTINPVPEPFDAVGPLTAESASPMPRSMLGR
jgi:hypothetical protein